MGRNCRYHTIILFVALFIGGCGELTPPNERNEQTAADSKGAYIVRPGDTLYSIAWGYGLDYRALAAWNKVPPPYLIHPGDRLSLTPPAASQSPLPSSRITANATPKFIAPPSGAVSSHSSAQGKKERPRRATPLKRNVNEKKPGSDSTNEKKTESNSLPGLDNQESGTKLITVWRWPTEGRLVAQFDAASGKKGIDIAGKRGQSIFSAAAGDVVYSGSGLLGYGNLVIIKHDDDYLSAYGHNSQLLVKEGDKVAIGQEIAKMGISSKEGAMLHFEIRKEGKPVDPTRFLPKKN